MKKAEPLAEDPFSSVKDPETDKEKIVKAYFEWKKVIGRYYGGKPKPEPGGFLFNISGITNHFQITKTGDSNMEKGNS